MLKVLKGDNKLLDGVVLATAAALLSTGLASDAAESAAGRVGGVGAKAIRAFAPSFKVELLRVGDPDKGRGLRLQLRVKIDLFDSDNRVRYDLDIPKLEAKIKAAWPCHMLQLTANGSFTLEYGRQAANVWVSIKPRKRPWAVPHVDPWDRYGRSGRKPGLPHLPVENAAMRGILQGASERAHGAAEEAWARFKMKVDLDPSLAEQALAEELDRLEGTLKGYDLERSLAMDDLRVAGRIWIKDHAARRESPQPPMQNR